MGLEGDIDISHDWMLKTSQSTNKIMKRQEAGARKATPNTNKKRHRRLGYLLYSYLIGGQRLM
jgi:hypothetical protein